MSDPVLLALDDAIDAYGNAVDLCHNAEGAKVRAREAALKAVADAIRGGWAFNEIIEGRHHYTQGLIASVLRQWQDELDRPTRVRTGTSNESARY
jgi:hypothetical protein